MGNGWESWGNGWHMGLPKNRRYPRLLYNNFMGKWSLTWYIFSCMPSNPNGYGSKPCYPGEYQNNRNMNVSAKKTLCYICTLYRWQNVGKTMPFLPPMIGNGNLVTIPPIKMVIFLGDGADGIVLPTFCQFWSIPIRGFSDTRGCAANSHHGVERLHKILGTQKGWDYSALCGQNNAIKHPPVIIILIGGMVTIPKWGGLWLF